MFYGASPELFKFARILRRNMTKSEQILWNRLKANNLNGLKFRRQHPIYCYIVDFYCHQHKLVIELDGEYHSKSNQKLIDGFRDEELKKLGLTVLRFTDQQVISETENVISSILNQIEFSSK